MIDQSLVQMVICRPADTYELLSLTPEFVRKYVL